VTLLGTTVLVSGCGSDDDAGAACEQAYNRSKECGVTVTPDPPECTARVACISECANKAPCDQLTSEAETNDFIECARACG